jgi:streptogramin lyase
VTFSGAKSTDPQGQALTYAWSFGDGSTGTGLSPTHMYGQVPGVASTAYTVGLTVTNTSGYSNQATTTATIQEAAALSDVGISGVMATGATPIAGAHVYLFAANTTGYGAASVSLLNATQTGTSDTVGAYVLSGSTGTFSMAGDYTCTSGQQLYIYALGGNPGTGANAASGLLAAIGSCPASTSAAIVAQVNEVSTVATAFALAGYATDAVHVSSSGTALAVVGIANAFANAANLETLGAGVALAATPAGNGRVPQTQINGLANILSACVNPALSSAGACTTLLAEATSSGAYGSGTTPTDTATAAINIAHYPAENVSDLYTIPLSVKTYTPGFSGQPSDFTIGLSYSGGGLNAPQGVAIDAAGNAWVANFGGNSVTKLSPVGAVLSGTGGFTAGGMSGPYSIAIDGSGNAWIANQTGNSVAKISSSGAAATGSPFGGGGLNKPEGIAIDGAGDAWVANFSANSVSELAGAGTFVSATGYTGGGQNEPAAIAIDGAGSAWVANQAGNNVSKLSNAGAVLSGANGFASGTLSAPEGIAIDGSGNAWITNSGAGSVAVLSNAGVLVSAGVYATGSLSNPQGIAIDGAGYAWIANQNGNSVVELSGSGTILSGANGYASTGGVSGPRQIAIDGSGDVWVTNNGSNAVTELIGAATPVVTPIAAGLPATATSGGTSKLGSKP